MAPARWARSTWPAKQSASSLILDTVPAVSPHQLPSQQTTMLFFVTGTTILWRGVGLAAYAGADQSDAGAQCARQAWLVCWRTYLRESEGVQLCKVP